MKTKLETFETEQSLTALAKKKTDVKGKSPDNSANADKLIEENVPSNLQN